LSNTKGGQPGWYGVKRSIYDRKVTDWAEKKRNRAAWGSKKKKVMRKKGVVRPIDRKSERKIGKKL